MASRRAKIDPDNAAVTIFFSNGRVFPPLYITSSMSDWQVQEMDFVINTTDEKVVFQFSKTFEDVPEGVQKYRFRAGMGPYWIVDPGVESGQYSWHFM